MKWLVIALVCLLACANPEKVKCRKNGGSVVETGCYEYTWYSTMDMGGGNTILIPHVATHCRSWFCKGAQPEVIE